MLLRGAFIALVAAVIVGVAPQLGNHTASADGHERPLQITVRNVTMGQPLTPAVVVVHSSNAVILPSSAERLSGLEALAESGSNTELIETFNARDGVKTVARFGGVITPLSGATIQNILAEPGDLVTVIGMLACTNDAIAVGTVVIPEFDALPALGSGRVLDAGTEDNSESEADVPCLGGEGVSGAEVADGEGEISAHAGITGSGDLSMETHGWVGSVISITVAERGSAILQAAPANINIRNMTLGQPITAPLIVAHDPSINPFEYTRPSELQGIGDFAEGGLAATLIPTLLETPGVIDVAQVPGSGPGGVILPGGTLSVETLALDGSHLSVAGMFACTNDAVVVARISVSINDGVVQLARDVGDVFDAGSENNDETTATVPCLGNVPAALSAGDGEGSRSEHSGVVGDADLNLNVHSWHPEGTMAVSIGGDALPPKALPSVGGYSPSGNWLLFGGLAGLSLLLLGAPMIARSLRNRG